MKLDAIQQRIVDILGGENPIFNGVPSGGIDTLNKETDVQENGPLDVHELEEVVAPVFEYGETQPAPVMPMTPKSSAPKRPP